MKGTLPQKIGRLIGDLSCHPGYLSRYAGHNLLAKSSPLELELPWFSYAAIDFLDQHLKGHMNVCEYGSGGSTLFCARRARSVHAIEDNPAWFDLVSEKVRLEQLGNVTLRLCPFDFKNPAGFESSEYLHAIPGELFDVIIVDGTEEWTPVRPACFLHARQFIKPGGIIVVDDSWRYPMLRSNHGGRGVKVFQSVGPCRPGVTSTDVFFF